MPVVSFAIVISQFAATFIDSVTCTYKNLVDGDRDFRFRPRISIRCFRNHDGDCWRVESESLDQVEPNTTAQGSDWTSSFFGTPQVGHLPDHPVRSRSLLDFQDTCGISGEIHQVFLYVDNGILCTRGKLRGGEKIIERKTV